jgi:hypothetical protein
MLSSHLFKPKKKKKLKLIGNDEFNHLINTLTLKLRLIHRITIPLEKMNYFY